METRDGIKNKAIFLIAFILFFYNAWRFLCEDKSVMPIPNSLFNMIFCLFIILISLHEDDLTKEKRNYQEKLEKYFKKFK